LPSGPENATDIEIHHEVPGEGQPIVLIHGYPLNGRSRERQEPARRRLPRDAPHSIS
jgi:non-heme chloroperoxidase